MDEWSLLIEVGGDDSGMIQVEVAKAVLPYAEYKAMQEKLRDERKELLLFCEHPPTITGGVQWKPQNLLRGEEQLREQGIPLVPIRRGGDLTAHEPGQLVIYPHVDLKQRNISLSDFFRTLLEISSDSILQVAGLSVETKKDYPGLYVNNRKICAIGVEARSFFTSSGVAINVNNDLSTFANIVACGLSQFEADSLQQILGQPLEMDGLIAAWSGGFQAFLEGRSRSELPSGADNR